MPNNVLSATSRSELRQCLRSCIRAVHRLFPAWTLGCPLVTGLFQLNRGLRRKLSTQGCGRGGRGGRGGWVLEAPRASLLPKAPARRMGFPELGDLFGAVFSPSLLQSHRLAPPNLVTIKEAAEREPQNVLGLLTLHPPPLIGKLLV